MNKYNKSNDYYNYINNYYNMQNFEQDVINSMYDPYNGLIRGNMFPQLFNNYKLSTPLEIQPMNEQAELLTSIDAYTFALIDLNLYLDMNPNNREAIQLFNKYKDKNEEYMKKYESKFGPLLITSDVSNSYPWAWNNNPWPWQNK